MKPILTYYGGKQRILKHILEIIPKHRLYIEPFFGGGAVFFGKEKSYNEIINDKLKYLYTFYKTLQDKEKFRELHRKITLTLYDQNYYKETAEILKNQDKYNDIDISWALFINIYLSFSQSVMSSFSKSFVKNSSITLRNKKKLLLMCHKRLSNAQILNTDAYELIKKADRENAFFYLDPPYPKTNQGHYKGYTIEDYKNLISILKNLKGKFILSNYIQDIEVPNNWNCKIIKSRMSAANSKYNKKKLRYEYLYYNYDL